MCSLEVQAISLVDEWPPTGMLNTMATDSDPKSKVSRAAEMVTVTLNTGRSFKKDQKGEERLY